MFSAGQLWTDGPTLVAVGRRLTFPSDGGETCRARPDRLGDARRSGLPSRGRGPCRGGAGGRGGGGRGPSSGGRRSTGGRSSRAGLVRAVRAARGGARPAAAQPGRSAGRGRRTRRATGRGPRRPLGSERGAGCHALGRPRPPAGPRSTRRQGATGSGAADRGHAPECGPDRRGRLDLPQDAEAARCPGRHPGQDVQQPRDDRGPTGPVRRGAGADRSGAGPGRGGRPVPDRRLHRG